MRNRKVLAVGLLMMSCLLVACSTATGTTTKVKPAEVVTDGAITRVTLTEKAAERVGITTALVADAGAVREGSSGTLTVPYSAVLYDAKGNVFVYTNPEGLTYVRAPIAVDYIEGDLAVLLDGPPSGTAVVTVGAAELYGAETGIK
jgi:multidrug efflux pump subunit AcrA (membrane-fusion protein)